MTIILLLLHYRYINKTEHYEDDIDNDFHKVLHLMDVAGEDIINKLDQFLENVASGLEKIFGKSEDDKKNPHF